MAKDQRFVEKMSPIAGKSGQRASRPARHGRARGALRFGEEADANEADRFRLTLYAAACLELAYHRSLLLASLDAELRAAGRALSVPLLGAAACVGGIRIRLTGFVRITDGPEARARVG